MLRKGFAMGCDEDNREKTVVITGASAGIGRAAVRRFAEAGYNVALIAGGRDGLEAAAAEVE
jgi:short-subunit dehydrogenase